MTMRLCTTLLALSVCLPGLAHAQVSGMASAGIASPGIGIIGRGGILIPLPAPNRPPQPLLAAPPAAGRGGAGKSGARLASADSWHDL